MRVPSDGDQRQRVIAGRYRLRSVLGQGSMGTVWSAFDEFLRRPVAVKEVKLPPGVPSEVAEDLQERALREARAIASLSHPNVITLHDVVRENGAPFVVMELLTARNLAELLDERGPASVEQAASVGDAVAAALAAAHAAGITHRDVKPGNVLVAHDGRIKLTDFGIARNVAEVTMTSSGLMLGSPAYMAPEVASGKKVTPAADLWSLGATLYSAVEGRPPYDINGDAVATASAVVHQDVPAPNPGPLAELISSLMNKDPDARPAPDEVRRRLHDLRAGPGPLFATELFTETAATVIAAEGTTAITDEEPPAEKPQGSRLAAEPGPLPFEPSPTASPPPPEPPTDAPPAVQRRGRRSRTATTALVLAVAVLFAGAAAGGFAAIRTLSGKPLLPPDTSVPPTTTTSSSKAPLAKRSGEILLPEEHPTAEFRISAPRGWTKFTALQDPLEPGLLPHSTRITFVSPDGRRTLSVQRYAGYLAAPYYGSTEDYLAAVRTMWPDGNWLDVGRDNAGEDDVAVYRTIDTGAQADVASLSRTTFARLHAEDSDLWVISVTVPADQERGGRTRLFDRLAKTFTIS